jgi:hypothetical protein
VPAARHFQAKKQRRQSNKAVARGGHSNGFILLQRSFHPADNAGFHCARCPALPLRETNHLKPIALP